jgi:glutamate-1-semialdehyde 2,1-aminomutase
VAEAASLTNTEWAARARRVLPGGVDSPVRSFKAVGGEPFTVIRGDGPYVYDADGRRLVDLVQSYGAVLLGHAHAAVTEAVADAAAKGTTFGTPTPGEVLLAEAMVERVPGLEQVRFVSSGTEAAMSAVRLARGVTGRDRIVKFAGCYHGHSDGLLAGGGSGVATLGLPGSAGVPAGAVAETLVVPYNAVPQLDERVACVIVEPVAANMNLVRPEPGFLNALRAACDAVGALLIFDEVITGFRLAPGGASVRVGVAPDLFCFGKVIGGGLPVGAFGGSAELMAHLAPTGPVYQAGTLSGNPLATAAGLAVLEAVSADEYVALEKSARRFAAAFGEAIAAGGLSVVVTAEGPLVGLVVGPPEAEVKAPRDYDSASRAVDGAVYPLFFHQMIEHGVFIAPGPYEVLFPGLGHDDAVLGRVVDAGAAASEAVASHLGS